MDLIDKHPCSSPKMIAFCNINTQIDLILYKLHAYAQRKKVMRMKFSRSIKQTRSTALVGAWLPTSEWKKSNNELVWYLKLINLFLVENNEFMAQKEKNALTF